MAIAVTVEEAVLPDKPVLRRLLEFYLYDLSEFEGRDVDAHGCYGYTYLDHYWTDPERHAYLIRVDGQIAGFALVNRHTITGEDRRAIAEFFVMRKYRGRGAGRQAAGAIFDLWPGRWEVAPLAASPGAYAFWRKAVGDYTANDFEERRIDDGSCAGTVLLFSSRSGDR